MESRLSNRDKFKIFPTFVSIAPDVPPSNVVSHNGTSPPNDTSTCKLSWDIVADVVNKYNVTAYHLMYIKEGSNKSQFAQRQACNPTKILSGLDFYSKYVVQISAANQNGIGPYSAPVYCFTKGLGELSNFYLLRSVCGSRGSLAFFYLLMGFFHGVSLDFLTCTISHV